MSCGICHGTVNRDDEMKVACTGCGLVHHGICVGLDSAGLDYLRINKVPWLCDKCKTKKVNPKAAINPGRRNLIGDLDCTSLLSESQFKQLEEKLVSVIHNSIGPISMRLDSIESNLNKFETLFNENKQLKRKIDELESRFDIVEQKTKEKFIQIHGLPQNTVKNVTDTVLEVLNKGLGATIVSADIKSCYYIKPALNKNKISDNIMVEFADVTTKNAIMELKHKHKIKILGKNVGIPTAKIIYINESITAYKRKLWNDCKGLKISKNYKYMWMRNSNILMRHNDGTKIISIKSFLDLEKL